MGGHTDKWRDTDGYVGRQTSDFISLLLFFKNKKSRLKMELRETDFVDRR
jgi:hypothetical protein